MHEIVDIMGAIVTVALVTTIVSHPGTAKVVKSFGDSFSGSLRAAEGN